MIGFGAVDAIVDRLKPKLVIPHHYYIWDVLQRQSTLQTPDHWIDKYEDVTRIEGPRAVYTAQDLASLDRAVHYFGDHVAFDKAAWFEKGR